MMKVKFMHIRRRANNIISEAKYKIYCFSGSLKGSLINAYWGGGPLNLGDFLPPILLKHYGLTPIKTPKTKIDTAEILTIGSILNWVSNEYSGFIVGSGLMYDAKRNFPYAKILAVRGALTRDCIGAPKATPLGDPGLLVSKIYSKHRTKKYTLGLVPHYVDKQDERLQRIFNRYPDEVKIIDIQQKPEFVISDIDQCENILSSSLHGLITADALGIPGGWILLSNNVAGKGFKFHDYSSALDLSIEPKIISGNEKLTDLTYLTRRVDERVIKVQRDLNDIFINLSSEVKNINKNSHV